MVDRSHDFNLVILSNEITSDVLANVGRKLRNVSPFLMKSSDLISQIESFNNLLIASYDNYVGFNRFFNRQYDAHGRLVSSNNIMDDDDKMTFDKEIKTFIATITSQMQELYVYIESLEDADNFIGKQQLEFHKQVVNSVSSELQSFYKLSEKMQKERTIRQVSPFRLITSENITLSIKHHNSSNTITKKTVINQKVISASFAQRYIDEIAPMSKVKYFHI